VIPSLTGSLTRLDLDWNDAAFLAQAIPQLPGEEQDNSPVTLDLAKQARIRARGSEEGPTTELLLARSQCTGKNVQVCINRKFLSRAVALSFSELCVVSADVPVVFRDASRKYVIMPLGKETVLGASKNAVCIASTSEESSARPAVTHKREGTEFPNSSEPSLPAAVKNGDAKGSNGKHSPQTTAGDLAELVTEAEALKDDLRRAFTRTHQLLLAAKKYRRQNRLVQSTLATLQQLKKVAG
jgi:hypothetical protein